MKPTAGDSFKAFSNFEPFLAAVDDASYSHHNTDRATMKTNVSYQLQIVPSLLHYCCPLVESVGAVLNIFFIGYGINLLNSIILIFTLVI